MTREEAERRVDMPDIAPGGERFETTEELINEIFDEFESVDCENCKHNGDHKYEQYCNLLLEFNMKYCNKFELKDIV